MEDLSAIGPDLDDSHFTRAEEVHSTKKARRNSGKLWTKSGYNSGSSSKSTKSSTESYPHSSSGSASLGSTDLDQDFDDEEEPLPSRRHGQRGSNDQADGDDTDQSNEDN